MDLDDLDIYEDLDTFQLEEEKKTAELVSLEAKYNDSLKTIETLQLENADLKKQIKRIGINFQNLLDTAKSEIKRKDKQIEQLRKEKDDICFRRKQPRREYTDVASTSQNPNIWFKNETVLPTHDFARNTNENTQITGKNVEAIDNEQPSETSYNKRGRENTRTLDEYEKSERRNESFERKYDCDPQREKYNRSDKQKDQHVSRYTMRSTERDGSVRSATRDYNHSHNRRTADRSNRDERDFKNKTFKSENEKGSFTSTENGRRQHSYDRLGDRSRYHGKEAKNKTESYERRHDRRSDSKETRTKSDSSEDRHDRRSESKHHREDTNKITKETNEKARADKIRNETQTFSKNSDDLIQSKNFRGKAPNISESRREKKLNENQNIETVKESDFLDKDLRASKDSQSLEKLLAEEKLTKEKLSALEDEYPCKETDKNANRLMSADGMTTPKKTALFDQLFGSTPTNAGDVNSNTLSNVIEFLKSSSSSATTSPSNYTDTSEPTTITSTNKRKNAESEEYYIPIKVEQNGHNKTEARLVANSYNRDLEDTQTSDGFTVGTKPKKFISSTKNQAANENSNEESATSVKATEETVDYAKIATLMLSEDEEETEFDKVAETHEDEMVNKETKTNGNKKNDGIQILQNIRLPNIYEIRAHQRRLRELAAAKRAKLAKIAETNGTKPHATQSITKMVVPATPQVTKSLQKNSTTTTNAAENNKGVDLQEERVEAKIEEKKTINNSPQLYGGVTADANVITLDNKMTKKVSGSETTNNAEQQSIEIVKLLDKNVSLPSETVGNIETTNNDKTVANDANNAALKQMTFDTVCIKRQNESEESRISSKNTEKSEEVLNGIEEIDDIANSKHTEKIDEIATTEIILNEIFSKALETVEIVVEKVEVQNDTKSAQIAIKKTDTISAVSPTPNRHSEKEQTSGLRLELTTESQTTAPNMDMSAMNSNLLTKALPTDSERKQKSMVESKENISISQQLDESKEAVSRSSKKSENTAVNAPVGADAAQPIACGENTKNILCKSAMDVEEKVSCEQNAIAQQDKIAEHEKVNEPKTCLTHEEFVQEPEKMLKSVNAANEATIAVKVELAVLKSNCDSVLSEEKSAGDNRESPDATAEQKTVARSEVAIQKAATESIVYKNEELLGSTDTTNECSSIIENDITKSSELMITDATMSIVNDSEEKSECNRNVELSPNGDNSIITTTKLSAMAESGTAPVIEVSESAKPNGCMSGETAVAEGTAESGSRTIIEESEGTKRNGISEDSAITEGTSELRESEATVSYLINKMDKPTNSTIEGNAKITAAQNIPNLETKGVVNNLVKPTNSYIEKNEKIIEAQNVPTLETKCVVKSKEVELQPKTVQEFADDSQRSKNTKTKSKELSNTVNISTERNLLIENMKRAEVLWKFKIPKISAKRKREESADGSRFQESKNVETFEVKREKLGIKAEEAIIPHKKKKTTKLITKQMQEETKVLEINGNMVKNLLETKTLFENQKKSERIIKEIDNWARRKVGDTTDILETENPIEYKDKIPTDMKVFVKQKTEKHKTHKDNNNESFADASKCVSEKQQEHNKPPTEARSTRERSCDKRDQTHLLKGQHTKIPERRKNQPKVEHEETTKGTKTQNVKYDVEMPKESSQKHEEVVAKCGEKLAAKSERSELKTRKVESIEKANNSVKKALGTREFEEKTKKYFNTNYQNEITVKKALGTRELDDKTKKCTTTQNIPSKSPLDVATVSCEIKSVKCDISEGSADNLKQTKDCDKNCFVMVQKLTATESSATEVMQVVTPAHASNKQCAATIASVTNTETTSNIQSISSTYAQTPKRRKTSTSSDDAEVVPKSQRRKRCKMRIEDSDEEENAAHALPTAVPTERHVAKHNDLDRKNKDIIDILQNDRANESNDNLPAPQTPTSLPMNVSQDAEYEEIDSRLQLMFASPKIADKTSSTNALAVANQLSTQLLQPTLKARAVVTDVIASALPKTADKTLTAKPIVVENTFKSELTQQSLQNPAVAMGVTESPTPETADKTSSSNSLVVASSAVVTAVTGTEPQPVIVLPPTVAPIGNPKPLADFNATESFLSDISANSFLASDLNVTIDETNHSGMNPHTSLSDSSLSTKHISLGSSDYRFEKVSENVVNLFITRKRRGKRKPTAATITTNTVTAT